MRRLAALALIVAILAGACSSSGGSGGHGSGDYPAPGEIWVGTGLGSFTAETAPLLSGRSDSISSRAAMVAVIGHLPGALKSTADVKIDGTTTYAVVLYTYATSDGEWWFYTSFTPDAKGFGLQGGEQPRIGPHTITLVSGYPTAMVQATGTFTLIP